jgi:hypothetical protein
MIGDVWTKNKERYIVAQAFTEEEVFAVKNGTKDDIGCFVDEATKRILILPMKWYNPTKLGFSKGL